MKIWGRTQRLKPVTKRPPPRPGPPLCDVTGSLVRDHEQFDKHSKFSGQSSATRNPAPTPGDPAPFFPETLAAAPPATHRPRRPRLRARRAPGVSRPANPHPGPHPRPRPWRRPRPAPGEGDDREGGLARGKVRDPEGPAVRGREGPGRSRAGAPGARQGSSPQSLPRRLPCEPRRTSTPPSHPSLRPPPRARLHLPRVGRPPRPEGSDAVPGRRPRCRPRRRSLSAPLPPPSARWTLPARADLAGPGAASSPPRAARHPPPARPRAPARHSPRRRRRRRRPSPALRPPALRPSAAAPPRPRRGTAQGPA